MSSYNIGWNLEIEKKCYLVTLCGRRRGRTDERTDGWRRKICPGISWEEGVGDMSKDFYQRAVIF